MTFDELNLIACCPAGRRRAPPPYNPAVRDAVRKACNAFLGSKEKGEKPSFSELLAKSAKKVKDRAYPAIKTASAYITRWLETHDELTVGVGETIALKDANGDEWMDGEYDLLVINQKIAFVVCVPCPWTDIDREAPDFPPTSENRYAHALALAVMQDYKVDKVSVLMLDEIEGLAYEHDFKRGKESEVLFQHLVELWEMRDHPSRVLYAGHHCMSCKFAGTCPAVAGTIREAAATIVPLETPKSFIPHAVHDAGQMALLRHWVFILEGILDDIKHAATEMCVKRKLNGLVAEINGRLVHYDLEWMRDPREKFPAEAGWKLAKELGVDMSDFMKACFTGPRDFENIATTAIGKKLRQAGKEPAWTDIRRQIKERMEELDLVPKRDATIPFLRRRRDSSWWKTSAAVAREAAKRGVKPSPPHRWRDAY